MNISGSSIIHMLELVLLLLLQPVPLVQAWMPSTTHKSSTTTMTLRRTSQLWGDNGDATSTVHQDVSVVEKTVISSGGSSVPSTTNRRTWLQQSIVRPTLSSAAVTLLLLASPPQQLLLQPAWAATRPPLPDLLYTILRVREATEQETRLIQSGKFKDVQRANVKLAVRFMVENYRLNDAFVSAAAYLDGNDRRIAAGEVGQTAVQNLVTIMEYFDSADVQNLKVGSSVMAGKEGLVLKGLESTKRNIDEFLTYFPSAEVEAAKAKIASENKLNLEEFDPSLGAPINLAPKT